MAICEELGIPWDKKSKNATLDGKEISTLFSIEALFGGVDYFSVDVDAESKASDTNLDGVYNSTRFLCSQNTLVAA